MSAKALLIEDDEDLVGLFREALADIGFETEHAFDGEAGLDKALAGGYGIILLDMKLPKLGGAEVCKRLRQRDSRTPLVIVSSVSDQVNKILLLELGADDYIVKPFDVYELKARINAILRRVSERPQTAPSPAQAGRVITIKEVVIDLDRRKVRLNDRLVDLTATEFDIVALLAMNPGRPFTRDQLNEAIYGYEVTGYDQSVISHISRIRTKLEPDPSKPQYLLTVRGVGYCFVEP